jgi:Family of unknown function (DUF6940)
MSGSIGKETAWTSRSEQLPGGRGIRMVVHLDSSPVPYAEVLHRWRTDAHFRAWFNGLLVDSPFASFRWETPPLTTANGNRPFECVLLDSPGLATNPNAEAFSEHFGKAVDGVVEVLNLGKDAILIIPSPIGAWSSYGHLGAFVRQAPEPQMHALWKLVGTAMQSRLSTKPVWLSTAGAGVSWLHVRLDDRPKYYGYKPYREIP